LHKLQVAAFDPDSGTWQSLNTDLKVTCLKLRDRELWVGTYDQGLWRYELDSKKWTEKSEACGYSPVRNPDAEDGLWKLEGRRQVIYARNTLDRKKRLEAARRHLVRGQRSVRSVKSVIFHCGQFFCLARTPFVKNQLLLLFGEKNLEEWIFTDFTD
jgi:ligand-binding sensor domain-containing protein